METNRPAASTDSYGVAAASALATESHGNNLITRSSHFFLDEEALPLTSRFTLGILALLGLGCLHALLYQLHYVLVPFVMGGFIVLTLQPTVEILYRFFAGLAPPHRWGGCCCKRRNLYGAKRWATWSQAVNMADDSDDEAEALPLLTPRIGEDVTVASMADGMARFIAVTCVFLGMLLLATLLVLGLYHGAIRMKAHPDAYMGGLHRLESLRDAIIDELMRDLHLDKKLHDGFTTETKLMDSLLDKTREWVWHFVDMTISGLSESLSSAAIMLLYVLFWLLQPLPTGGRAGRLVRKYLYKKTFASFLYGLCVMLLFLLLGIDMAVLFGVVSFFLNFVPEIGSFISILVPIPVILLDGRHQNPLLVLMLAVIGQLVFKFIFSNVLEVKLIEHDSDLRVHPVWVILGLSYFGYIWGPIGMLISVPILAFVKTMATSLRQSSLMENLPPGGKAEWRNLAAQFVICLEGSSSRKKSAFGSRQSSN